MLDSRRLRTALAVDAVATVAAGVLVALRPEMLRPLLPEREILAPLREERFARALGLAVATFGAGKGSLYAVALARYGGGGTGNDVTE